MPNQIYRDQQDNFYVDGRHIEQPEFQSLGINADFVPRGATVSLNQAVVGRPEGVSGDGPDLSGLPPEWAVMYAELEKYLGELKKRGEAINPNVEITPEKVAEFTAKASSEIDPYFSGQLKLARESFLRDSGYSVEQLGQFEQNLERQYGKQHRELGESAAERGFAQSGIRQREEGELATGTQRLLDLNRQQTQFQAGTAARTFAQQFGGLQGQAMPGAPQIGAAPRVLPGQGTFQQEPGRQLPFYELSPETYSGLIGEQEFTRRGSIASRTSELEKAERSRLALAQQRQLTF